MTNQIKKIIEFIFEVGTLRRMNRQHLQKLAKTEDSVADHSFRVAVIGYLLAKEEGVDADKVLRMCLFHDIAEARTGDHDWFHKKYVKINEWKVIKSQWQEFSFGKDVIKLFKEYLVRKTKEAKIAKEADELEQIFQLKEYADQGNKEAERWLPHNSKRIKSKIGKEIIRELKKSNIHDWWWKRWK